MYLSLGPGEALEAGVRDACQRHGWPVLAANDESAERRLYALRLADACILDVSIADRDAGAELAVALCEGRPVIALRPETAESTPILDELTRDHPRVRQLSYRGLEDCLAALNVVLGEEQWQEQVARAAPDG
jgi:hypothetical protein